MSHHKIEFDEKCKSCSGNGLYNGMGERDGAAVVCHTCNGTGCHHAVIEYDDFEGRKDNPKIKRVFEVNPGICIDASENFGGMPYANWANGEPFPPKSENRLYTCPAWWYQTANYDKMPDWDECSKIGSFSGCDHFKNKAKCWQKWDEENN